MNEQKIIEDTVLNICKIENDFFKINAVIITTFKEDVDSKKEKKKTTEDVLKSSLKSGRLSGYKNIHIFKDYDLRGNMATQLNHGIEELKIFLPLNTYYLVLNADSVISSTTINSLGDLVNKHPGSRGQVLFYACENANILI